MQDVENWFETEGSVARRTGIILITQKRKKPLQKLRRALKRHAGMTACPILRSGAGGYAIQLGLEDSARFVRVFKKGVKTAKAMKDLELADQALRRKRKQYRSPARNAIRILDGKDW